MKTRVTLLVAGLLGLAPAGFGQETNAPPPAEVAEAEPQRIWRFTAEGLWQSISYTQDALQHRSDYDEEDDPLWDWEDGSSDGDGYGARLTIGRETELASVSVVESDSSYELFIPRSARNTGSTGRHTIKTERLDVALAYARIVEGDPAGEDKGLWGWTLGGRFIDSDKQVEIYEENYGATDFESFDGDVSWKMFTGGYFGMWRPLGWRVEVYGAVNVLFGDVDGVARQGNDTLLDGRVTEEYSKSENSLAYGANFWVGLGIRPLRQVIIMATYGREWLYSFEATDSGVVVFPDNDDALFIDNQHVVTVYVGVTL